MIEINGLPLKVTIFPDKTSQVWKISEFVLHQTNYVRVRWKFENEGEFMHLAQLKDLLDQSGIASDLWLDYLPYGRQDKQVSNSSTFALHTFARLLNSLHFRSVEIMDPHSDVATEIINNAVAKYPGIALTQALDATKSEVLCYPDKGAQAKYAHRFEMRSIRADKTRDQLDGKITNYELVGDPKDQVVMIVDDICDGGTTFVMLAHMLYAAGAKEVNLFVTHGIFSKGLVPLQYANIKHIFTNQGEITI